MLQGATYAETKVADVLGRDVSASARLRCATDRATGREVWIAKDACHYGGKQHSIHETYCGTVIHDRVDTVCF